MHRTNLHTKEEPCPRAMRKLLERFSGTEVLVLARYAVGGFASGAMKAKWDGGEDNTCPLCGSVDSRYHRLFECPATEHARSHWRPLVEPILQSRPAWTHAFHATLPPDLDLANLMFATRRFSVGTAHLLPSLVQGLTRLRFFTDGSCKFPSIPYARHAGFGVVLDTMPDLPEESMDACLARAQYDHSVMPFVPVATGLVPDEQNINRAEVCALIRAAELAGPYRSMSVEFCSDSSFAISEIETVLSGGGGVYPDLTPLVRDVWHDTFHLRKVRAHTDMAQLRGSALWDAAGNDMADRAKSAIAADFDFLGTTMADIARFSLEQMDELFLFAKCILDVSYEENRLKQLQRSSVETNVPLVDRRAVDARNEGIEIWVGRVPAGASFMTASQGHGQRRF